ncbi:MAG: DUF1599 domain-containing protein [Cytophagaceae bacterium]|nr:DUF1599 domain-containing protein [Cytophagaceae bacterium]
MVHETNQQFEHIISVCLDIFDKKMKDYGAAWRILRPSSMTDQILIKAQRIRNLETKGFSKIDEGIRSEYIGIVNYATMALIQMEMGVAATPEMPCDKATELYLKHIHAAKQLMDNKNHDYDEAWRSMRISSMTDLILMKIYRTKQIEDNKGETLLSEGVDANYMDMINYAVFALIKMEYGEKQIIV